MPQIDGDTAPPRRVLRSLAHVGITVTDLDYAIDWYCDILGFELILGPISIDVGAGDDHASAGARDVFGDQCQAFRQAHLITANGVGIELFEFVDPPTERPTPAFAYWNVGIFHICVLDPDVEALAERIRQSGGLIRTSSIRESYPGEPYRWCYCQDPFGNIIEIYSHPDAQVYANRAAVPSVGSRSGQAD
jgi:catechol 2,3-dioxygenase-like lactoylglutathione lyase family enzyme